MYMALAALVMTVLIASAPASAEIYRWVDAHGVTHLSDRLDDVPESARSDAKVFQSRTKAAPSAASSGPTQAGFADAVARGLGLIASDTQDAVSALHIVGIYPSVGWNPAGALTPVVVDEVTRAARTAARSRRLAFSEGGAEAAVLRVAASLGVPGPPPTVVEPPPAREPTIVVAPNIVVESPPPTVVVNTIERRPDPMLTRYGFDWPVAGGFLYAPIRGRSKPGPIPDRIVPLSSPAGRLRGPAVPSRPRPGPFQRPPVL
jgi:hypothetical protein